MECKEEGVEQWGALKVLRRQRLGPQRMLPWERERRLLARLAHPYTAGRIESGTLAGGLPYLLMECMEGERVEIMRKVCDAVAASHQQMVAHRDWKPGNILISRDGLPKLVDFGIAQAMDIWPWMPGSGTEAYVSLEQLAGEMTTMATAVFSLGWSLERLVEEKDEELGAIIGNATDRRPESRYETVEE